MKITHAITPTPQKPSWQFVLTLILVCLVPEQVSSLLGMAILGTSWWDALAKPAFAPAGWWMFLLVWIINYTVMGIAVAHVWPRRRERLTRIALLLFAIQIVVGLVWIPLVYGFHSLLLGLLLDIFALLLALGTTWMFRRIAYQAAWWMLPYVVWLVYTMVLKFVMWRLN